MPTSQHPLVSIIVPSYNHKRYVAQTIASVLRQTYRNIELIVVDDGSIDGSKELLAALADEKKFKLITQANKGVCAALNRGIAESQGEFISFIASDDLMTENRIEEQVQMLLDNGRIDVIAGGAILIDETGSSIGKRVPRRAGNVTMRQMLRRNPVLAPTAMMRKRIYEIVGKYDETVPIEDLYMWIRAIKAGLIIYNTQKIWAFYRVTHVDREKKFKWYYQGYKKVFEQFLPEKFATEALERYKLIFLAKMTLLLGTKPLLEYKDLLNTLPVLYRIALQAIGLAPQFLRHFALTKISKTS